MEEPVSSQSTTQPSPAWLAGLLENSFLSDVKIEVESTIIPAHKFALSIASPVFKTMFEFKDVAENVDSLITLPDMELVVFRLLLKFVYTGTVENMNKHDFNLLIAADKVAFCCLDFGSFPSLILLYAFHSTKWMHCWNYAKRLSSRTV